jgi:3-oxoacyl-[acyl-carrier-protein] synthase-1
MQQALSEAGLDINDINYINMHGTGTEANDAMEGTAINNLFGNSTLCASTKQLTGHTLGASGAIEIALSWLMIKNNFIIPHKFDGVYDDRIPKINLATGKENIKINNILSNSFAFGGSNVSVILGDAND